MARTTNFLDLNFDSVLLIFKFLQSLEDQVNLASCSQIFRNAFVQLCSHRFKKIIDNDIKLKTLDEWRAFLWMCGANVETLESYYDDEHPLQILPLVRKYCTNLKSITLHNATVARTQPFILSMPKLQKLYVRNYKSTSKDFIKSLLRLPHIRSLGFDCFDRRELQELRHFHNLNELILYDDITTSDFVSIIKPMRNLRVLQLRNAKRFLTTYTLKQLIERCHQLEKFSFYDSDAELSMIAQFSNLKYLQLTCPDHLKTGLFRALAARCSTHLQYLILHRKRWINEEQAQSIAKLRVLKLLICKPKDDRCMEHLSQLTQLEQVSIQCAREVSELALMNLVASNEKLSLLNICYCTSVTDEFVMYLLKMMDQRCASYNRPLLNLYAAATDIRRDFMEKLSADPRSHLVQLCFECCISIVCDGHQYFDDPEFDRAH